MTVCLQAGATFTGNFILRRKPDQGAIVLRSTATDRLPPGSRIAPRQNSWMARIVSPNTNPALQTESGAHDYRLIGLEITTTWDSKKQTLYSLVALGNNETELSQIPQGFVIDRCYVHGSENGNLRRLIAANAASVAVIDSYLTDAHEDGRDAQCIEVWNSPGPFKIDNNYLNCATENVLFGGGPVKAPGAQPSDITITHNHFDKTYGQPWSIKNLLELKNAVRVLIEENVFTWNSPVMHTQAILLNGVDGPSSTIEDVTVRNNVIKDTGMAFVASANAYRPQMRPTNSLLVTNNVIYGLTDRFAFAIYPGCENVRIEQNTVDHAQPSSFLQTGNSATSSIKGLVVKDNIGRYGTYGIVNASLPLLVDPVITGNIFAGASKDGERLYSTRFPDNHFVEKLEDVGFVSISERDYRLTGNSKYRVASDGTDVGADLDANALLQKYGSGPASSPTHRRTLHEADK
jgi:hypothetical protein